MNPTSHEPLLLKYTHLRGPVPAQAVRGRLWLMLMAVKSNSHGVELIEMPNANLHP